MSDGRQVTENDIHFNSRNDVQDFLIEDLTLEGYSTRIIKWFLEKNNNNVVKVANKLDVGKSTIYRMIKEGKI